MKTRTSAVFLVWCILNVSAFSQSVQWVKQIGATGYSLTTDQDDNFYISGAFENTVTFDTVSVTSSGYEDIYVSKYSSNGNLIWVRTAGGEFYDEGFSLASNNSGENVYVTGFMKDAVFGDTLVYGYPFFVSNYNSSGDLQWVRSLITSGGGGAPSVAVDKDGNLYLTGSAFGLSVPDSLGFSHSNFFVTRIDTTGTLLWIKGTGPTHNSIAVQTAHEGITCDIHDNIYVAGGIQTEEVKFDNSHTLVPEGIMNLFVVKYDSAGNVLLALQSKGSGQSYPNAIAVDTTGNIYLTGCFEDSVKFGDIILKSIGSFDIFTVEYNVNGELVWVRQAGSSKYDSGRNLQVDAEGNVFVTGISAQSADFNGSVLDKTSAFLAKYDTEGNLVYVKSIFHTADNIKSPEGYFLVTDLAIMKNKDILITGYNSTVAYFDSLQIPAAAAGNIFVAKLADKTTGVVVKKTIPLSIELHQNYPNPFNPNTKIRYQLPHAGRVSLTVFNMLGQKVKTLVDEVQSEGFHETSWNGDTDNRLKVSSGMYFYRLEAGGLVDVKKMVMLK